MPNLNKKDYDRARKLVKDADVGQGVKALLNCALKSYYSGTSLPLREEFESTSWNNKTVHRCLVGAALADKMKARADEEIYEKVEDRYEKLVSGDGLDGCEDDWVVVAAHDFGIRTSAVNRIIAAFDSPLNSSERRNSRVFRLAAQISEIVAPLNEDLDY